MAVLSTMALLLVSAVAHWAEWPVQASMHRTVIEQMRSAEVRKRERYVGRRPLPCSATMPCVHREVDLLQRAGTQVKMGRPAQRCRRRHRATKKAYLRRLLCFKLLRTAQRIGVLCV